MRDLPRMSGDFSSYPALKKVGDLFAAFFGVIDGHFCRPCRGLCRFSLTAAGGHVIGLFSARFGFDGDGFGSVVDALHGDDGGLETVLTDTVDFLSGFDGAFDGVVDDYFVAFFDRIDGFLAAVHGGLADVMNRFFGTIGGFDDYRLRSFIH